MDAEKIGVEANMKTFATINKITKLRLSDNSECRCRKWRNQF